MFEISAHHSHTRAKTLSPLFDYVVDHALVQACPFLNDMLSVTTHPHFGVSGCKPAAEERSISCNRPGWGLDCLEATVTTGWSLVSGTWADRPVSRCRILLEGEVTWQLFYIRQKFFARELCDSTDNLFSHQDRWNDDHNWSNANTPIDSIIELLIVGRRRNKWLGAVSWFCKEYLTINIF